MPAPGLKHELKARHLFTLGFGTIVGVGWITVLGHWLASGGSVGAIVAFTVGGLLMVAIGLCYSEVSSIFPAAGGEVVYANHAFGPAAGFAAGWTLTLIYITVTAFEAISVGWITTVLVPQLQGPVVYEVFGSEVTLGSLGVGLAGMAIISYLNYRGARETAGFQDLMTYGLIIISLAFIVVGLAGGDVAHLRPLFASPDVPGAFSGIATVFVTTPFFYAGFNVLPQAIGEKSPDVSPRTVNAMILLSIVGAFVFYALVILSCSMTLPREQLLELDLPAAGAFESAFDSVALGNVVLVAGFLGLITTWNAVFFAGVRVLMALSHAGTLPAVLGVIHPRYGTPGRAVLVAAIVGTALMMLGRGAISLIVNTAGFCFALMFFAVAAILIYLRVREPDRVRPFRIPGGMIVPLIAIISAVGMIVISLWEHLRAAAGFPAEWIVLAAWLLIGLAFWFALLPQRRRLGQAERA